MDTHGITNQLRSAIRAKLKELKVRYDEELPDYILVMVANKKTRQQMHDDLNLFLEDCTTEFVEWLHDQVLKKLQKVTVAKKKSSRELVPMVVVKQEEERKKRKISATSFLEDQTAEQTVTEKHPDKSKNEKQQSGQKQPTTRSSVSSQNLEHKNAEKNAKNTHDKTKVDEPSHSRNESIASKRQQNSTHNEGEMEEITAQENSATKTTDLPHTQSETSSKSVKRTLDTSSSRYNSDSEEKQDSAKRSKLSEEEKEDATLLSSSDVSRKLKSCVNKPKITSVVSVKDRLGVASPRKKFDSYREKEDSSRYNAEKRYESSYHYDNNRNRNRNFEDSRSSRRNRDSDTSHHDEVSKIGDARNRIISSKNERLSKIAELREKSQSSSSKKTDTAAKKSVCTVKNRLSVASADNRVQKQPVKQQEHVDYRHNSKSLENIGGNSKNIKNRLGPLRNNFKPVQSKKQSRSSEEYESPNFDAEERTEEEDESGSHEELRTGPVKSHIVAINRSVTSVVRTERKRPRVSDEVSYSTTKNFKSHLSKTRKEAPSDPDNDVEDTKLPSKVIVAPRPLKPLQPLQKRATQSLLLRAVAEANQSVVAQKNPEPSLVGKKPVLKPALARGVSQNLSILVGNSNKRLVMEKIQVELNTVNSQEAEDVEPEPYVPQAVNVVTDDHMGVVMSLFQRNDNNQKFLVTLNGYSNHPAKEKITSEEDEEQLEMEVNEDELALLTTQNETYATAAQSQLESTALRITTDTAQDDANTSPKETNGEENNENCNTENMDKTDEAPRKRRKLSPIVYNRSHSPSPTPPLKPDTLSLLTHKKSTDKKLLVENSVPTLLDKSKEKCKYWPNCTSGNKCAYFHPKCSAFPACKFGDKCAYKHPKCKFGLSCTKLSCVFSHPTHDLAQQCKYYPLCKKKSCPYFHPTTSIPVAEVTSQRAKFTWRRQD